MKMIRFWFGLMFSVISMYGWVNAAAAKALEPNTVFPKALESKTVVPKQAAAVPKVAQVLKPKANLTSSLPVAPITQASTSQVIVPKVSVASTMPVPKNSPSTTAAVAKIAPKVKVDTPAVPVTTYISDLQSTSVQSAACTQIASVVYSQQIQTAPISAQEKQVLMGVWNSLYLGYLVRQSGSEIFVRSGTSKTAVDQYWQALKTDPSSYATNPFCVYTALKQDPADIAKMHICMDTASLQEQANNPTNCQNNLANMYESCAFYNQCLDKMLTHLDPKTFTPLPNHVDNVQSNYATFHLRKVVERMKATCSVVRQGLSCQTKFTGDIRDMGVIVNIQNNTSHSFALHQKSVTGSDAKQIGILKHGLNSVSLHTAALQAPTATAEMPSNYMFDISVMTPNVSAHSVISVKMMSGKELVTLLRSVSKNKKDIFLLNGRKVAKKYAVDEKLTFLVIVQIPSDADSSQEIPTGQRIQAFSLSQLSGPFLMTMQINEEDVEILGKDQKPTGKKQNILQPSFVSVQTIQNTGIQKQQLPMLILPQFLSAIPTLQLYWMMLTTIYIAASTDFEFFGEKCFANDFMYFEKLGYLDKNKICRIIVDVNNVFLSTTELYQIPNITIGALFETDLLQAHDVPMLYMTQDNNGNLAANDSANISFNILLDFNKLNNSDVSYSFFNEHGFNLIYDMPDSTKMFVTLSSALLKEGVFVYITKKTQKNYSQYEVVFKDKKDKDLGKYYLYMHHEIKNLKVDFVGVNSIWKGMQVPEKLLHLTDFEQLRDRSFRLQCIEEPSAVHMLQVSQISPIDKVEYVHAIKFSKYPILGLYLDVYNKFQISSITRCVIVENGMLPVFLQALSEMDWRKGVYMITNVKNNDKCSKESPGALTVTFYQGDEYTYLGSLSVSGINDQTHLSGIREPVHSYNLGGDPFVSYFDIFLTTALLLQYDPNLA